MWGENWGTMMWGGAPAAIEQVQVPIGPWALLLLGFLLGVSAVLSRRYCVVRMVPLLVVVLVPMMSVAANLITFANGTTADAGEVNANFAVLNDEIAALQAQIATLKIQQSANTTSIATDTNTNTNTTIATEGTDLTPILPDIGVNSAAGGNRNTASANFASVSGGRDNTASENYASVSAGQNNTARDFYSSVSGGLSHTADASYASVSGGGSNTASGQEASVSGGFGRTASGQLDWRAGSLFEDF